MHQAGHDVRTLSVHDSAGSAPHGMTVRSGCCNSWFMSTGMSREVADRLAAALRREISDPVEVHEGENGFVVHVIKRRGIFYIHSPGQWDRDRRVITVPDAPTRDSDPLLAHQTQQAMEQGASSAVRELRSLGVVRANSFLGFHLQPVVWLVTEHDAERDQLLADDRLQDLVLLHLSRAGVRDDLTARGGVTVESEETVDRDFNGSWYHAMK